MNTEYFLSFVQIGQVDMNLTVETSGTKQSLIKYVNSVGCCQYDNTTIRAKAIHLGEQLIQHILSFIVTTHCRILTTSSTHRIYLIDKNNTRSFFFGLFKEVAHSRRAD